MNKKVTITVSGATGTGKSTIASVIAAALEEHCVQFSVELIDGKLPNDVSTYNRISALKEQGLKVKIIEQQPLRNNS